VKVVLQAQSDGRRFKAAFIVCIRNLISQQTSALRRILGYDVVRGADYKLDLSVLFEYTDVVVATAQVRPTHWPGAFVSVLKIYESLGHYSKVLALVLILFTSLT